PLLERLGNTETESGGGQGNRGRRRRAQNQAAQCNLRRTTKPHPPSMVSPGRPVPGRRRKDPAAARFFPKSGHSLSPVRRRVRLAERQGAVPCCSSRSAANTISTSDCSESPFVFIPCFGW